MANTSVFRIDEYVDHQFIVTANCFFFPPINLSELLERFFGSGENIAVRPGRIEVSDAPASLHSHEGLTVIFIASGYGILKSEHEDFEVRTGDVLVIPPKALHVSIAGPNTTMVEYSIFIGNPENFDALEE